MIIATSLVMDRLRKRLLELTPELPEDQVLPAIERFIQEQGEEHDAEEAYRYYLSEKYDHAFPDALDSDELAAGSRSYAMADVDDSYLIALDGSYFRLEGITEP